MNNKIVLYSSLGVLFLLILISIIGNMFSGWSFFGIIFYICLYLGGYFYVKIGMENRKNQNDVTLQSRHKFEYCWERVNYRLSLMAGGNTIEWAEGFNRSSIIRSFFDGIQNKPFRCIIGNFKNTQQLVVIIYDIEGDDISAFYTNPSAEILLNPFLHFKPYSRTSEIDDNSTDRFGGIGNSMRGPDHFNKTPISINVDPGYQPSQESFKTQPEEKTVNNVINKMRN